MIEIVNVKASKYLGRHFSTTNVQSEQADFNVEIEEPSKMAAILRQGVEESARLQPKEFGAVAAQRGGQNLAWKDWDLDRTHRTWPLGHFEDKDKDKDEEEDKVASPHYIFVPCQQ